MLLSSEPPAPHVLAEYTEGRSTRKGGRCPPQERSFPSALFTKAQVAHPLSKLRKALFRFVKAIIPKCPSLREISRGCPVTTLPLPGGAAQKSLCPPTNATAKHSRLRLRQEVPNSVAGALLWSRERAGGGPSSRLTRACPFLQAYTPVNSES